MNLIYDFLFIAGILFSSFYVYILLKSKELNLSKYILIVFFGIIIIVLLESYGYIHSIEWLKYSSFAIAYGTKLLIGPLLIAYIQSLFIEDKKIIRKNKFLVIPYVIFTLLVSIPYAVARLFNGYFIHHIYLIEHFSQYLRIGLDIILLLYLYLAFRKFIAYRKIYKCHYSYVEEKNFVWVRYLLISVSVVISIDLLIALSQMFLNAFPIRSQNIIMSLVALCIVIGAYFGVNQSKVLVPYFLLESGDDSEVKEKSLSTEQKNEFTKIESLLNEIMKEQKPYTDEELTLSKLASYIQITDKKLSTVLNQHLNTTFYNYVNSFRLEAFKRKLQDEAFKDLTIEGIAYDCGFKSKASFYRLFKKETGVSPSEYKKALK